MLLRLKHTWASHIIQRAYTSSLK